MFSYEADTARASPTLLAIASLPTAVSLLLWLIFETRRNRPGFTPAMIILGQVVALAATAAQGVLVYRLFELLHCDEHLALEWVSVPLVAGGLIHLLLIVVVANRFPRFASSIVWLAAVACVVLEYLGREVVVTSAVQTLVPLQQLYCTLLVTFLTHVKRRRVGRVRISSTSNTTSSGSAVDHVDPLQRRTARKERDEEDRWTSWWN